MATVAESLGWPVVLGVLGAIIGSFVAALVIRWPAGRSVMAGRSACDACGKTLTAIELVPMLSYVVQRGRCRGCDTAIDPVHWRIEAAGAAIGALAGIVAPHPVAVAGAVFGWLLLALAMLDLRHFWLPDRLTAIVALAGIGAGALGVAPPMFDRALGGALGFAMLWLIAAGYRRLRGREGMGGGDPKLMGAIGLWLGWRMLPAVLLIASATGLAVVLVGYLRGRAVARDTAMPLGTLLAVAAYPAWLVMIGTSS